MFVQALKITEVIKISRPRFSDSRGYFCEVYNRRDFEALGIGCDFVQDNQALSSEVGTLRGLHFQLAPDPQAKLVRVVAGAIFDVAVDLRASSPTFGKWCGTTLAATAADEEMLFVPAGFAHAYVTLEPNTVVAYKVDRFYNKAAERGLHWADPDIGIDWPIASDTIKVSAKDAALPRLRDVRGGESARLNKTSAGQTICA